jgi:methyl-accepting chemotaxis protein
MPIESLKIRTKLALLVLPLLVTLTLVSLDKVWVFWTEKNQYALSTLVVSEVADLGHLVHELQSERGLSAGFLASGASETTAAALKAQRVKTDAMLTQAQASVTHLMGKQAASSASAATPSPTPSPTTVPSIAGLRQALLAKRQEVDGQVLSGGAAIQWFSGQITVLIDAIDGAVAYAPSVEFAQRIHAYSFLVNYKEFSGRERAAINATVTADKPLAAGPLAQLIGNIARQDNYDKLYRQTATLADVQALTQALDKAAVKEALAMRQVVLKRAADGNFDIKPSVWWAAISEKMNILKAQDDQLTQQLMALSRELSDQAALHFSIASALMLALAALFLTLTLWITRSIQKPLDALQSTMNHIADTFDLSRRVPVRGSDEIAMTSASFNRMLQVISDALGEVNTAMAALATGDFSQPVKAQLKGDMNQLKTSVNTSLAQVEATIATLNQVTQALYAGDFAYAVDVNAQGEYGKALSNAQRAMLSLKNMLGDVGQVMRQVASGDLSRRVSADGLGDLRVLRDNVNTSLDALGQAMREINMNARQLAAASKETAEAISQIADGAQNQTMAISQVSVAVRQSSQAIVDVSKNTEMASGKSRESVTRVQAGVEKMAAMVQVVTAIASNSEKISKITEVIEKIANKTNLLSLNAAIEAARAGEHGKGFAVVADEVGKLAISSAASSQEIALLVQAASSETAKAVSAVTEVSRDMAQVGEIAQETDSLLQRISSSLEEQASAIEEINANLSGLDRIANSNAAAAEEMTASVMSLSNSADATRREVSRFTLKGQ